MNDLSTCAHTACRCTKPYSPQMLAASTRRVDPNDEYCSDRCRTMASDGILAGACECGHPECSPAQTNDIPPMQ